MRSIVVGVDGRERSYRALAFSAGLARRESAELAVCYVRPSVRWQSFVLASLPAMALLPVSWDSVAMEGAACVATAQAVSEEAAVAFDATGIPGDVFVRTGDIVKELARLADERLADLVVIGTPRRLRSRSAAITSRLTHGFRRGLYIAP